MTDKLYHEKLLTGLLRDYYSYKKLLDKNSGFKNLEKSGRIEALC